MPTEVLALENRGPLVPPRGRMQSLALEGCECLSLGKWVKAQRGHTNAILLLSMDTTAQQGFPGLPPAGTQQPGALGNTSPPEVIKASSGSRACAGTWSPGGREGTEEILAGLKAPLLFPLTGKLSCQVCIRSDANPGSASL